MNWKHCAGMLIGMLCMLGAYGKGIGKEVEVEELSISLYNKPVTGFRLTLDRSERFVANQIIAHVASVEQANPFQYERSIIYENIRYSPIAQDRDLSLYFLLKSIQGQFTELTWVVMYDYRRSVNTREFPELAMKLKIDLAKLVRQTSGDVVRYGDMLMDDTMLAKLETNPDPEDSAKPQPTATHFKEEEVENEGVLLRRDPFKPEAKSNDASRNSTPDTTLQRLNARIQSLEAREQEWMTTERNLRNEQASLQRQHDILLAKVKETKRLQDSVNMLNERVEALIGHSYVADDVSVSNETAAELAHLEKENRRLTRQQEILGAENDSLHKVAAAYSEQLNRLTAGGKTNAAQIAELDTENKNLRQALQEYKAREALGLSGQGDGAKATAVVDSLLDLLAAAQVKNATLREESETMNRNLGRLKEDNDYLNGKKMQLEERITSLEAENRTLRQGNAEVIASMPDENLIDSLKGEIRTARRTAGTAEAELTQIKADMEALQKEKDNQERQLVAAQTEQKALQALITALEAGGTASRTIQPTNPEDGNRADSLLLLRQKLRLAEARAEDAGAYKDALIKVQTDLQARDRELRKAQYDLTTRTNELAEANKTKTALQKSLQEAEARLADGANSRTASQQEADRLKQENRSLNGDLEAANQALDRANVENKALSDSLQAGLAAAGNREKDLRRSVALLQGRVDSLARIRVPEGEQARFLKEQRAKLDQLEKDLDAREMATSDKEKLMSQRESVLQKREDELAAQEGRFKDLEERERRVLLLEQQLNARESGGTIDANTPIQVREGRVVEFGNHVPVFIVEMPLNYKAAQRQVVGYMLSRDELIDERFPELVFRAANLTELDAGPVEVKARIDSRGAGTILQISFRLSDGEYLGGEKYRERTALAKQLISKMLRYKI
jgi:chromosome segregation ATPase